MTVAALVHADERLRREFPRISIPVLHSAWDGRQGDQTERQRASSRTVGSKDKTLKLYEGHYHDLLNDVGKEGVLAEIRGWIEKRLPA